MAGTVQDVLERAVAHGERRAYLTQEGSDWRGVTWGEVATAVDELTVGFADLGIKPGDRVAILARTRLEWALCDWALLCMGAVVVPIYPTCSVDDVGHIIRDSGAVALVCEDAEQLDRVERASTTGEAGPRLVVMDPPEGDTTVTLEALRAAGADRLAEGADAAASLRPAVVADDLATIIYTSGTTGDPKGCVLTHGNLSAAVTSAREVPHLLTSDEVIVLFLPLAHAFGRLCLLAGAEIAGTIAFCPDVARVAQAVAAVKPTLLPTVPRLLEKVESATRSSIERATGPRGRLGRWALRVADRVTSTRTTGGRAGPGLRLTYRVADRLVYAKVRARLGGNVRLAISGGAALPSHVAEFFITLGLPVVEGYGLSECTALASVGHPGSHRVGTVGPAVPGGELRIAEDGEIQVRSGTVFSGYWGDEAATAAAMTSDGWLRTGDIGELDGVGNLTITDRQKDIIVTASGKNVSPLRVEGALKTSPLISEALVIGDQRPFIVALITLEEDVGGDDVGERVAKAVREANMTLGTEERVRNHRILDRQFDPERGEITPTLKVRRGVCAQHFAAEIEELYAGRV